MILSLIFVFTFIWITYRYLTRNFDYWSKQNVPFVKPLPIIGSVNLMKLDNLHEVEQQNYKKYGRIYGSYEGSTPVLTVADPNLLKNILIKDFNVFPNHRDLKANDPILDNSLFVMQGSDWKRVRNIVSPIFTAAKLRKMMSHLEECTDIVIQKFDELLEHKESIICQKYFGKFTMAAIGRCAFGIRISEEDEDIIVEKAKAILSCTFSWRTAVILIFPKLIKWFGISVMNPDTLNYFQGLMKGVVEKSKASERKGRAIFLQTLIDAEDRFSDKNNNGKYEENIGNCAQHLQTAKGLTPEETIAQCIVFFTAGFDATTSAMSHSIHQLAVHPHYQQKVLDEINETLAQNRNEWSYETISNLKFLNAVMCEALRICPTLLRSERQAEEDYILGETGIKIKKGMIVSIPVFAMHRDPEWFPDPEVFRPERFLTNDLEPQPYTYLPFGGGPRICLGKRFVEVSARMCLAKIVRKFRIELANPEKVNLDIVELRGILKVSSVEVKLTLRD